MPRYEVVTPLRNGGKKPVAPGKIIEMDADDAAYLVEVKALRSAPDDASESAREPQPAKLADLSFKELIALAKTSEIALGKARTKDAIVTLIEPVLGDEADEIVAAIIKARG